MFLIEYDCVLTSIEPKAYSEKSSFTLGLIWNKIEVSSKSKSLDLALPFQTNKTLMQTDIY